MTTSDIEPNTQRRKPWLAALLSFATTGMGQIYNGQWKKGLLYFAVESVLGLLVVLGMGTFKTLVMGVGALLIVNLLIAGEAFFTARRRGDYVLRPCNRGWVYALVFLVNVGVGSGIEWMTSEQLYKSYKIPSGSMLQTLQVGDHFMGEVLNDSSPLDRGWIVVFEFPEDANKDFVKRVVGLPGDTVHIRDKILYINGEQLDEPYVQHTEEDFKPIRDNLGPFTLEPQHYFLMGDNREGSYDSRWFGPVKRDKIKARAGYIYFPGEMDDPDWGKRLGMVVR